VNAAWRIFLTTRWLRIWENEVRTAHPPFRKRPAICRNVNLKRWIIAGSGPAGEWPYEPGMESIEKRVFAFGFGALQGILLFRPQARTWRPKGSNAQLRPSTAVVPPVLKAKRPRYGSRITNLGNHLRKSEGFRVTKPFRFAAKPPIIMSAIGRFGALFLRRAET
jgi:hypothetical protein